MIRYPDWPQRLEAFVQSRMAAPFVWGEQDCCRFAAAAVEAMTGRDPMQQFHYRSEWGALKLIREGGSLEALVTHELGSPLPTVAMARRGDVVLADLALGPTVGVCLGIISAFAGGDGLIHCQTLACRLAWGVG